MREDCDVGDVREILVKESWRLCCDDVDVVGGFASELCDLIEEKLVRFRLSN